MSRAKSTQKAAPVATPEVDTPVEAAPVAEKAPEAAEKPLTAAEQANIRVYGRKEG